MKYSLPRVLLACLLLLSLMSGLISCDAPAPPAEEEAPIDQPTTHQSESPFLVILGVAQDAGYPQAGCKKSCCAPAWEDSGKRRNAVSLGLIDPISNQKWLFEATPDFPEQLRMMETTHPSTADAGLAGIFLTHGHIGHYTGLIHLGREVMDAPAVPVFAMPRMRSFLTENGPWSQLVKLENIALTSLAADSSIQLNDRLSVTPFLVPHRDEFTETVGFRIDGPNQKIIFIPDIDKWEKWETEIAEVVAENDVLYLDGTFYANGEIPGRDMSEIPHPFVEETMAKLSELPAEQKAKVHLIHFNHTNPVLNPHSEAHSQVLKMGFNIAKQGSFLDL